MTHASELFDLSGKVAVVTGGSRGLGREMVLAFAEHGADVVIASRKLDACVALADEVTARFGRRAIPVACHVGYWDQVDALADRVRDELGRIDVLVNNAGMSPLYPSLTEISEALYDKVMDVNLKGTFRLSVVVGERMAAGDGGSIISVSSGAAITPTPGEAVYGLAKAALHNMSTMLSKAYAPKVRSNVIMPGPFLTDISKAWGSPEEVRERFEGLPLGRAGEPEEVVGAALFLASDASSYSTGGVIDLTGGVRA
jgi:NAD(P)-dependent dehydrogenase (short-subunit alcohol dehydrogenase family)